MIVMSSRRNMQTHFFLILGLVHSLNGDVQHQSPLETMADVTNDFGVCVLQIISTPNSNMVFSPYGLVSMALLVYEGATGQAAAEIYNTLHLPWHRDIVRIGFRDLHRYLRSYFSSEGFLKGLILSKPNVHLRPQYVEVLKFYGFQPDTAITQPALTTQTFPQGNETTTTTNVPATSTIPVPTTLTTMKDVMTTLPITTTIGVKNKTETTVPETTTQPITTTTETATEVVTSTNKVPTPPEVLAMQGATTTTDSTITAKTIITTTNPGETTIVSGTTKKETIPTVPSETTTEQINTDANTTPPNEYITTTIPPTKAIVNQEMKTEIVTKKIEATTMSPTRPIVTQETQTETATTEMNVVTMTDKQPPQLESMDMVLQKQNKTLEKPPGSTQSNVQTETEEATTEPFRTIFAQLIPVDNKEKKKEVFTKKTEPIPFSTMIVDTTVPFEELVILTTPPDAEVIEDKGSSMLEAIIILQEKDANSYPDTTTDNTIKRSTKYESAGSNQQTTKHFQQYPTTYSYIFSSLNGLNYTQTTYKLMPEDDHPASLEEQKDNSLTSSFEYTDANEESTSSVENTSETMYTGHTQSMEIDVSMVDDVPSDSSFGEEANGFPTLEPDTIIFPTISDPRLPRSVRSDEKPPAQLGNWVGVAATWRSNPTDQWFWTYSGDKLVPVLTYTAFLPYAEVPALQATALQLPLDDSRYSLLVLLPKSSHGLKQMLHTLQWNSLRTILKSLKPTPVYAVVPAFTIVKHINLTPALHKLGIRNVFDAYVANLAEMSDEPNLYVRSVEQTVTISVRKYFAYHKWFEASPSQVERNFLATHPFAYFVMDEETKVALIAGTIVDPLQHTT